MTEPQEERERKREKRRTSEQTNHHSLFFLSSFFFKPSQQRIPGVEGACITSLAWVTLSIDEEEDEIEDGEDGEDKQEREATADDNARAQRLPDSSPSSPSQALVSAGLDGSLTLWDLRARAPGCVLDAGGGAIWSLAVDERGGNGDTGKRLAAACDDGALRVFTAVRGRRGGSSFSSSSSSSSSPSLKLSVAFPRASGRALSVAWHPGGRALVSGSSEGTLRAWDVATRRELFRVDAAGGSGKSSSPSSSARRGKRGDEVPSTAPLWAVAVADDGTLATGDGEGCVSFWDAEHGTLLARFPGAHASDVLALVAASAAGGSGSGSGGNSGSSGRGRGGRRRGRDGSSSSYEGVGAGGTIFSAGADGRVASFVHQGAGEHEEGEEEKEERQVRQRSGGQPPQQQSQQQHRRRNGGWAAGPARAPHTHDVRCLALLSIPSPSSPPPSSGGGGGGAGTGSKGPGGSAGAGAAGPPPQLLVSGGADAQLIVYARSSFATEHPARACRAPQPPLLAVSLPASAAANATGGGGGGGEDGAAVAGVGFAANEARGPTLLLASQRRAVDVWRLGVSSCSAAGEDEKQASGDSRGKRGSSAKATHAPPATAPSPFAHLVEGARVDVVTRPSRLARIELAGSDHVLASALASSVSSSSTTSGSKLLSVVVAASTPARTALFELKEEEEEESFKGGNGVEKARSVRRVPLPAGVPPAAAVAFAGPRRLLAAACGDGSLSVVDLSEEGGAAGEEEKKTLVASLAATLSPPHASKTANPPSATTAAISCPPVSGLAVSDCGRWAATWSTGGRCHVFDLKGLEHSWSPPPLLSLSPSSYPSSSLAGAAFTADGDLLLLSSSGTLASYDVQGRFLRPPTPRGAWEEAGERAGSAAVEANIGDLPGSPTGVSTLPRAGSRAVLVCTPSALCAADLAAPRTPGRDAFTAPRSRRAARAAAAGGGAAHSSSPSTPAPAGSNPRPLPLEHPCLGSFYLSSKEALLVEAVWADVAARSLPPPVVRRRFGA